MPRKNKMKYDIKRITKFLISGLSAAALEYAVFLLLDMLLGNKLIIVCQSVSFMCGLCVSFILNRKWVFKSSGNKKAELIRYLILALTNLLLSNILIVSLVSIRVTFWIAKIIVMAAIATWNYSIFQKFIFKS
jgi:putative flippase GtrA